MAVTQKPLDSRRWNEALESGSPDLQFTYDPQQDFFGLTLTAPRPAYSHDQDGALWQIDLETNTVIGLYVYGFKQFYLPSQPEIAAWWQQFPNQERAKKEADLLARFWRALTHRLPDEPPSSEAAPRLPPAVARLLKLPCA